MRARPLILSLALALGALAPTTAFAQEAAARPGADAYTQRIQQGIQLLLAGDSSGATNAFREAVGMDGNRPMALYYLATANRMSGNAEDALSGFRQAAQKAAEAREPRWQARALEGVATTLERMDGRLEDALTAWQEYVRFADANQAVAHPQVGRARVSAINAMSEQERVYVEVRERIATRERENAR